MRVLVTGGAGFVGRQVCAELLDLGADVRVVDVAPDAAGRVPAGVELVEGDLAEAAVADTATEGVDAVCHQAAKVGLGVDFGDAESYVHHNVTGTASLLGALWRRSFASRLVLASSMVVYGEGRYRCGEHGLVTAGVRRPADLDAGRFDPPCPHPGCHHDLAWAPVGEDAATEPRNVYAATKLHQEHLATMFGRASGAGVVALRYHNVYGPGMPRDTPYSGVAAIFRSELVSGRAPQVNEDGAQARDFVHVSDVARANVAALTRAGVPSGAYNVASGTPRTVGELAGSLVRALGSPLSPVVTGRWRPGDVRHIVASPHRATEILGFSARVAFDDGMAELALAGG
ncbi:MAG: NAD-dependent epimerase/dehydratase family protein [Acidimicrobiales bacterium]